MHDPGRVEGLGLDLEADPPVELDRVELGGEAGTGEPPLDGSIDRQLEHPQRDAATAPVASDGHPPDLRGLAVAQQPEGADHLVPVGVARHHVQSGRVEPVVLLLERDSLFATEHQLPDRDRAREVLLAARPADRRRALALDGAHRR